MKEMKKIILFMMAVVLVAIIAGYATGYILGHRDNFASGNTTGYRDNYLSGYVSGNSTGYSQGYKYGAETGYKDGYSTSYKFILDSIKGRIQW